MADNDLREMRLQRTAALLRDRAGNAAEVADSIGLASISAFSRRFRERFEETPAAYARPAEKPDAHFVVPHLVVPLILATLMALLTACSGTSILNTLNNAGGHRSQQGIAYGEHARQKLDVYQPKKGTGQCVVMFVYGGSWTDGSKGDYGFVGAALARRGYTVVITDYRLYPQVTYPAFVQDIALALASEPVQQLIQSRKLVMMGHSAGAMIAGLVSYNPDYLQAVDLSRDMIDGYIALAGPHDYFLPTQKHKWTRIFGENQDEQVKALTVNHVHSDNPPTLIVHGSGDETVTPKSAHSLAEKLTRAGVPSTKLIYDDVGHVRLAAAMGRPLGFLAPTLDDVDAFLQGICGRG